MFNLSFGIRNPFSDRFHIVKFWSGQTPLRNKFWEFQINETADIVAFDIRYTAKQDHAGLFFAFGLVGYEIIFNFYDNRHWNRQKKDWENYDFA